MRRRAGVRSPGSGCKPGSATLRVTTFRARSKWARGAHFSCADSGVRTVSWQRSTGEGETAVSRGFPHGRRRRFRASRCSRSRSPGKERFCVYVDHPAGVDHALCERVTDVLRPYLDRYSVEVSSPGFDRPLRTREHFERAVGPQRVALKTADRRRCAARSSPPASAPFQLENGAGEPADIPYDEIVRANLIDEG